MRFAPVGAALLLHGSGLDEFAFLAVPMALFVIARVITGRRARRRDDDPPTPPPSEP